MSASKSYPKVNAMISALLPYWLGIKMPMRCVVVLIIFWTTCTSGTVASAQQLPPPPGMTFSCSPNPIYENVSATCTAHVGGGATGNVALSISGTVYANPPLDSNGNAVIPTGPLNPPPGLLVVNANYSGDSNYAPAQATGVLAVFNSTIPISAETLTCSPYILYDLNGGNSNPASCTLHVPGGATGQVTFTVDGNAWATAAIDGPSGNAIAAQGLLGLPQGVHTIQATYSGDSNFAGFSTSTTLTITSIQTQPKTMTVGCTPAPVAPDANGSCQVRLTGGATGSVTLYVNSQLIGSAQTLDTTGATTFSNLFNALPAGSYGVQAFYGGDSNFSTASAGTTVNVGNGTSAPTMAVTCSPSALTVGQLVACTAHVQKGATGSVSFTADGAAWNSAPISSNGLATVSGGLSGASLGTHTVFALYPGDANFQQASATANVAISNQTVAPPSFNLYCTPSSVVIPSNATCYASVGGGATGAIILYLNGNQDAGQNLDGNGHAVFQNVLYGFSGGATGSAQITASYLGDLNFSPATAATSVQLNAQPANPTITASITPTTIQNGAHITVTTHVSSGATGNVFITVSGQPIAALQLDPRGNATGSVDFNGYNPNNTYYFLFAYSGDANFNPVSITETLNVTPNGQGNPTPPPPPAVPTAPASGTPLYSYSITQPGGASGYAPNGNVVAYTDSVNGQWAAGYDFLNRLTSASQAATATTGQTVPTQNLCWGYDSFGNRQIQKRSGATPDCSVAPVAGENYVSASYDSGNHLTTAAGELVVPGNTHPAVSFQLDGAGNTTQDASNQYFYDGEGRLCAMSPLYANPVGYLYDAEGHRVAKGQINVPDGTFDPCDMTANGFRMTTEYIPGPDGEQMTEIDWSGGSPNWVHTNAYANGGLAATYINDGKGGSNFHFQLADWLGTRRLQTDYLGNPEETCSGGSFGDALNCVPVGGASDATEQHFTGKERDSESGLDNFGPRYYASSMGRFISPDDVGGHLEDPQTLNLYSYVGNNPLSRTDPSGHDFWQGCSTASANCGSQVIGQDVNGKNVSQLVSGTTDSNGKFTATVITSASLGQAGSGNTATVNGNGLTVTTGTGTSSQQSGQGIFINGTAAADIKGSGTGFDQFNFHIDHNDVAHGVLSEGTANYTGQGGYQGMVNAINSASINGKGPFSYFLDRINPGHPGSVAQDRFSPGDHPELKDYGPSPHFPVPQSGTSVPGFHVDNGTGPFHELCGATGKGCF